MTHALYCFWLALCEFGNILKSIGSIFFKKEFWVALKFTIITIGGITLLICAPVFVAQGVLEDPNPETNAAALAILIAGWLIELVFGAIIVRSRQICKEQEALEKL